MQCCYAQLRERKRAKQREHDKELRKANEEEAVLREIEAEKKHQAALAALDAPEPSSGFIRASAR